MEDIGCNKQDIKKNPSRDIKGKIMETLKDLKSGTIPEMEKMNEIYCNLTELDHHDAVRLDQILTIIANEKETEYKWASIVMNKKFKIL